MTTGNGQPDEILEGIVEQVTATGIKVDGTWASVSRFHPVDLPSRGSRVRLVVDGKAFIKSIEVLGATAAPSPAALSARDHTINRLSVLKSAATFLGAMAQMHEEVRSDHVLVLADKWLRWVEQTDDREEPEF